MDFWQWVFFYMVVLYLLIFFGNIKEAYENAKIKRIGRRSKIESPEEFLERAKKEDEYDYKGIYILYNKKKRKYYVGQSIHVLQRVTAHFKGHGNEDIYKDYRNGDRFTIRIIHLKGSGYSNLDKFEKEAIAAYKGFEKGYNKTRGNG